MVRPGLPGAAHCPVPWNAGQGKPLDRNRSGPWPWPFCPTASGPPPRETFRFFAQEGVSIRVISGDNPVTVSEVARRAGIAGAERYIDASHPEDRRGLCPGRPGVHRLRSGHTDNKKKLIRAMKKRDTP